MKQILPVIVSAVVGFLLLIDFFLDIPALKGPATEVQDWGVILAAFALALAAINLVGFHVRQIGRKSVDSIHSLILLAGLFATALSGIFMGTDSVVFDFIFRSIYTSLAAVFYAMTAFHLASASYRAFRLKNPLSAALIVSGVLLMLGKAPIGEHIWSGFPVISDWITGVVNVAGSRGILISTAIGSVGMALRVLTGIDRSYLGAGSE